MKRILFQTTLDSYSVVKNNSGFYVYAEKKNGQLHPTTTKGLLIRGGRKLLNR